MTEHPVALTDADVHDAGRTLALAHQEDPFQAYVCPDPRERAERSPSQFATLVRYGVLFGQAFTTPDRDAVAVWQPPGSDVTPERAGQAGITDLPGLLGLDAFQRFGRSLDFLGANNRADVPPEHWYLMVVGVVPDKQGRGLGSALVRHVLDQIELPCLLDTAQPRNVPFYEGLGFRVHADNVDPSSGLRWWTFRRDP